MTHDEFVDVRDRHESKPVGVVILAVLHLIGGIVLSAVLLPLLSQMDRIAEPAQLLDIPPWLIVGSAAFLAALSFTAGCGLLLGARWGWWACAFYYVYGIARNLNALAAVIMWSDQFEPDSNRGLSYYLAKHSLRVLVHILILSYLFRPRTRGYFFPEGLNARAALGKLVGAIVLLGALGTVASLVS